MATVKTADKRRLALAVHLTVHHRAQMEQLEPQREPCGFTVEGLLSLPPRDVTAVHNVLHGQPTHG